MIGLDSGWKECAKEEGLCSFEPKNDSQQFFIICVIVSLCREETMRVEGCRVLSVIVVLHNDSS